jgi:hypothetical protein
MSYNIAVWSGTRPASDADATAEFDRRYDAMEQDAPPTPEIVDYIAEISATYPDLTEIDDDDVDDSPWADGPLANNAAGSTFYFALVPSQAEAVIPFLVDVARRRGLVIYDPQEERVL